MKVDASLVYLILIFAAVFSAAQAAFGLLGQAKVVALFPPMTGG